MKELQIEYINTIYLKPYKNNARKHTYKDVKYIENSIKEFGMIDPIGIWGDNNLVVEGHGRLIACKNLGIETVPCIRLDTLTDEQRKAYALAHNKTAEMSEWDFDMLDLELDDIELDMSDFGFIIYDDSYIDDLFEEQEEKRKEKKQIICPHCGLPIGR